MLVISDRRWMQLLLPPSIALVYLWFGRNILVSTSRYGVLTRSRTTMLWGGVLSLLLFMYGVTFNRELRDLWWTNPVVFGGLGALVLLCLAFVVVKLCRSSNDKSASDRRIAGPVELHGSHMGSAPHSYAPPSLGSRIRRWALLIWAVVGIGGTLAAIVWKLFRR